MSFRKTLLAVAAFGGLAALGSSAHAAYTITVTQQGSNVIATGSGYTPELNPCGADMAVPAGTASVTQGA